MTSLADLDTQMGLQGLAELRKPFAPEVIGKLPRVTQREGAKSRCPECGGFLAPHIHLDYVGHAEVTDRLLSVDPLWSWEPFALDTDGLPLIRNGRLWIRLTVLGVTRIGVGSVLEAKPDLEKELISDAIRNAAMRFGVALDLWAKADLESQLTESPPVTPPVRRERGAAKRQEPSNGMSRPASSPSGGGDTPTPITSHDTNGGVSLPERLVMVRAAFDALPPPSKNAWLKEAKVLSLPASMRAADRWTPEYLTLAENLLEEITASEEVRVLAHARAAGQEIPPCELNGSEPF